MKNRCNKIILILIFAFVLSACQTTMDSSSDPSEQSQAENPVDQPAQTTTYPLDHSQFRLLFDLEQLTKDYPEVFANVNIAASELAIKEITPGKALLEIKCHNNKYSPVALVLLDLNKPENYKAVVLSETKIMFI